MRLVSVNITRFLPQQFPNPAPYQHLNGFGKMQIVWPHTGTYRTRISGSGAQGCSWEIINVSELESIRGCWSCGYVAGPRCPVYKEGMKTASPLPHRDEKTRSSIIPDTLSSSEEKQHIRTECVIAVTLLKEHICLWPPRVAAQACFPLERNLRSLSISTCSGHFAAGTSSKDIYLGGGFGTTGFGGDGGGGGVHVGTCVCVHAYFVRGSRGQEGQLAISWHLCPSSWEWD